MEQQFYVRTILGDRAGKDYMIHVSNTQFESLFFATCPGVSWMVAGYGTSVMEALANLVEVLNVINRHASEFTRQVGVSRYILMVTTKEAKE